MDALSATPAIRPVGSLIAPQQVSWGRRTKSHWEASVGAAIIVALCPFWINLNWIALEHFSCSLSLAVQELCQRGPVQFALRYFPQPSMAAVVGYAAWLLWQTLLYGWLPGPTCVGQRTPGGHLLSYTTNGLMAWALTHLLYLTASALDIIDPAIVAKHWQGLLVTANIYGFILAILAQWKGYLAPSFPEDRKLSGSWIFDFWSGVELNPRFGKHWDFKFFHNGRPGIVAWTLIDISWAAYQLQTVGYVTNSMLVVLALQALYVVDFFWNEEWYTRTVDISHDHFGFMLAWGDCAFLPTFYTLQVQYLARQPRNLSTFHALALLTLGVGAYVVFRLVNHQRSHVRAKNGNVMVWGRPAEFIRCVYWTEDGKEHKTLLVTSGWWGICRHVNYLPDLVLAWTMCATCGFRHLLPWSYFLFMCVLLCHRAGRDERRCRNKYGEKFDEYCKVVPYRLIPGLY